MGGHVRSDAHVAVSGKLGCEIESVLHEAITLMAQDDRPEGSLALRRLSQERSRAFTKIHPRSVRPDILPFWRCSTRQSSCTDYPTAEAF
jgi:hypothetical protein